MDGAQKEGSPAAGRRRSGPGEVRQGAELHGAAGRQGLVQESALPASVRYFGRQDDGVYLAGLVSTRRRRHPIGKYSILPDHSSRDVAVAISSRSDRKSVAEGKRL